MHCVGRRVVCVTAILMFWVLGPARAVEKGQPLATALEELRNAGLPLIFSSALVDSSFVIGVEPGAGSPQEIARRILAPYGLGLEAIRPQLFAVVQLDRQPSPTAANASEAQLPLYQVNVYASRYQVNRSRAESAPTADLTRDELNARPGLTEDTLRATRYFPGTAANALSARSYVRGGRTDELAVFFDGVPLYEPFHFKDAQGLFGMLDPRAVSTLEFFSGVFPARFGNRLSGVLDIQPRVWEGSNHHELAASFLYSSFLTQGRLESWPVQWLASVRRSNIEAIADALEREEAQPDFLDALGRVQLELNDRTSIALGWLMLEDSADANIGSGEERANLVSRDATGWAALTIAPSDASELRLVLSRTERRTNRKGELERPGSSSGVLDDARHFGTTTARVEANARLNEGLRFNSGVEWQSFDAAYDYASAASFEPALASILGRPTAFARSYDFNARGDAYAAYASTLISIAPRVTLDAGLRWDVQRYGVFRDDQVSPRLSVQYRYDAATDFRLSWGRTAQTERPDELQVQDGEPLFHPAQRATQTVLSMERAFAHGPRIRVEAFDKRVRHPRPDFENLFDPLALLPELEADRVRVAPQSSRVYGAELSSRWSFADRWSAWTSYSWAEATDRFADHSALRSWDQKHSVATGLGWTHAPWQFSGNLNWHSGWRRNALQLSAGDDAIVELAPRNAAHWGDYLSLDLRAAWSYELRKGQLEVFAEVDNATGRYNPCCVSYSLLDSTGSPFLTRQVSTWLPRFFLLGVTWRLP